MWGKFYRNTILARSQKLSPESFSSSSNKIQVHFHLWSSNLKEKGNLPDRRCFPAAPEEHGHLGGTFSSHVWRVVLQGTWQEYFPTNSTWLKSMYLTKGWLHSRNSLNPFTNHVQWNWGDFQTAHISPNLWTATKHKGIKSGGFFLLCYH